MQALVEKRILTRRLWWLGLAAQGLGALPVALVFGIGPSASFLGGGFALLLGNSASALYVLRPGASSGASAMAGVLAGTMLKWMVVAAVLAVSMASPGSHVIWVFAGLVFAQVAVFVAVLTFKRR